MNEGSDNYYCGFNENESADDWDAHSKEVRDDCNADVCQYIEDLSTIIKRECGEDDNDDGGDIHCRRGMSCGAGNDTWDLGDSDCELAIRKIDICPLGSA